MERDQHEETTKHHSLMKTTLAILQVTTIMEDPTIFQLTVTIEVLWFVVIAKRQDMSGRDAIS